MLDIQRRIDVDSGRQQILDVLIAFDVAAAGNVGMGQLVDQNQLRPPRQDGFQIHFLELPAAIVDGLAGQGGQALNQTLGFAPAMGFDDADDHVDAFATPLMGRFQHRIGFSDTRRRAQEIFSRPRLSRPASASRASGEGRLSRSLLSAIGGVAWERTWGERTTKTPRHQGGSGTAGSVLAPQHRLFRLRRKSCGDARKRLGALVSWWFKTSRSYCNLPCGVTAWNALDPAPD